MRLRELRRLVDQLSKGGGVANPLGRIRRRLAADPFNPANEDADARSIVLNPDGTIFIPTKFPSKNVLVEVEPLLNTINTGYALCLPIVRDPANPDETTQTFDKAYLKGEAEGMAISLTIPLSFVVPAGWEYTLLVENDGTYGTVDLQFAQYIHETPMG